MPAATSQMHSAHKNFFVHLFHPREDANASGEGFWGRLLRGRFFLPVIGAQGPRHDFGKDGQHDPNVCRSCRELDQISQRFPIKRTPEQYELACNYLLKANSCVGKGATGIVKLALVKNAFGPCQQVALKELRRSKKCDESVEVFLSRVMDEYGIGASLHHRNIVRTLDLVRSGHRWYVVMEYCPGGNLFSRIKRHRLDEDEIRCIFRQLLEGVRYMHSRGIAHRDLKLENMLIDANGFLKIGDFGSVAVFKAGDWDTPHMCRGMCGSFPYIAPEEFDCDEYDPRQADIWSLGIIYFALSLHAVPWASARKSDPSFRKYLEHGINSFETFQRFPGDVQRLFTRMLDPNPNTRITIDELLRHEWFGNVKLCNLLPEGAHLDESIESAHYHSSKVDVIVWDLPAEETVCS